MKKIVWIFCSLLPLFGYSQHHVETKVKEDAITYVHPIIGASTSTEAGKSGHGLGKTFPGSATPFGMVQLSPDTKTGGDNGSGYSWHHKTIEGFSFIHMSGIGWYGDFGNFLVMPNTGELHTNSGFENKPESGYRSRYSHDNEVSKLGYYAVNLDDYNIRVELTSLPHSGIMRMTFPSGDSSRISIDLARRIGGSSTEQYIKVVNDTTIQGWMRCSFKDGGWGNGDGHVNYTVYFWCQVSKPFRKYGVWSANVSQRFSQRNRNAIETDEFQELTSKADILRGCREKQGEHLGFFTDFQTKANEHVLLKAGISFVSMEGARKNIEAEMPDWNFDKVRRINEELWRKTFNNIHIKGGTSDDKIKFYTSLYHTMIDPRSTSDVDGEYVGGDNQVHQNANYTYRTIFSGWDVFRSQFPLQTIINPQMVNDEVNSLINLATLSKKKYFARWEIMNSYSGCMLGNPAVSVLVDAYNKGIRNWDINLGYQYGRNSVNKFGNEPLGYSPLDISRTLEYAYTDWCMSEFARQKKNVDDEHIYVLRSQNYKNIWNDSVKWFRGRNADGSFGEWRGETCQNLYCTESNPLQQGWFVPHDIYGFMDLLGHEAFTRKLTDFFDKSPADFLWNDYYNHPNEPVHHVPFLFTYTGNSWLTQKWTRMICAKAYGTDVLGLCGNEDVGQMSAWYILASIGIHPVNPGDNIYIITSPVFNETTIALDPRYYKGKRFTIKAVNNSPENCYISKIYLNGKLLNRAWIRHQEIVNGGELKLIMSKVPNKTLGNTNLPPSLGRNHWKVE